MLKSHSVPAEQNNASAAKIPTTQEIAQAIASLDARKTSLNNNAVQTDTVSEIIDNLGLDMTAEDVLAEVQSQRARQVNTSRPMPKNHTLAVLVGIVTVFFFAIWQLNAPPHSDSSPSPAQDIVRTILFQGPTHLTIAPNAPVIDTSGNVETLKTLAEIPDGYTVWCGMNSSGFSADSDRYWALVKYNGKVYVRCWAAPRSAQAMQQVSKNTPITLCPNRKDADGNVLATVPLTLAVNNITLQQDHYSEDGYNLIARAVRLDSHAHEKWDP